MTRSHPAPPRRAQGKLVRRTTAGLVVAVLLMAGAAYSWDLGNRWGVADQGGSGSEDALAAQPIELELPPAAAATASPVAPAMTSAPADDRAVSAALASVPVKKLGPRLALAVGELGSGRLVAARGPARITPASTTKLLTCAAVLQELGPDHRFSTSVVRSGRDLVLVGGGDPLLARSPTGALPTGADRPADLQTLAVHAARALARAGLTKVRLGYDESLFEGPPVNPLWEPSYVPENVVSPISSLWADEGRRRPGYAGRVPDPAAAAAQVFAGSLRLAGVRVAGEPSPTVAQQGAQEVAVVESLPLAAIVEHTLELSDNEAAEVLARHVALARGQRPTFRGAVSAVEDTLGQLGVDLAGAFLGDGSGLARADRVDVQALLDVLVASAHQERLRALLVGLPVAGFTGSLAYRFEDAPRLSLGEVRAKTGTLTGVSGLAGVVRTRDGALLTFVAIADRIRPVNTLQARAQLDQIAGALAACRCRG